MTPESFAEFRHNAVHELTALNQQCEETYRISEWPRWDYDLDAGTLVFSKDNVPKVSASIQVVGTTSTVSHSWLWGWANQHLPSQAIERGKAVREFGIRENLLELTEESAADEEYLGWEFTAIMAQILGAKGAYRCPGTNGFLYFVYVDIQLADGSAKSPPKPIECDTHGRGHATYVCEHLAAEPKQAWFSEPVGESTPWPDAWCSQCDQAFQEQGEWNDKNESRLNIKLLCHHCYETARQSAT